MEISSFLPQDVLGCNVSPVSGFQPPDESLVYLCYAVSKEDGSFSFYSLPSGGYTVVSERVGLYLFGTPWLDRSLYESAFRMMTHMMR